VERNALAKSEVFFKDFLKEGSKDADVNEGKFVLNIDVLFAL
jgi:hypothetical protein